MSFSGIHHLVIRVNNLDETIAHWRDNLGLTLSRTQVNEQLGVKQAMFDLVDGGFVELIAPIRSDSALADTLRNRGEGLHLVSMSVADVQDTLARCEERGVAVIDRDGGPKFIHPKSASGVMLGLSEVGDDQVA